MMQLAAMRWTVLFSVLLGALLGSIGPGPLLYLYDIAVPVVNMRGQLVARGDNSVDVHMWGSKNRNCKYLGILAYSHQTNSGLLRDASITRLDRKSTGDTKPRGDFDIGVWRIAPIAGALEVLVYVQHDCDGRAVDTLIAEIDI